MHWLENELYGLCSIPRREVRDRFSKSVWLLVALQNAVNVHWEVVN